MELRQLRYFLAVAEEGHITRAAEKLYISQPALSQQIKLLEEEIGTVLFDRIGRRIRLTAAGEILVAHARRALQELSEAQVAIDELNGLQRGMLRIGVVQTVNAYLMPDLVAAFTNAYPAISLQIEELATRDIEQRLADGDLQIGIGFVPPETAGVTGEELFSEDLVVVVSRQHPWADLPQLPVQSLHQQPLILLSTTFCTRRLWDRCTHIAGIQPRVQIEMNTIGSILAAVRQLTLATVLPAMVLSGQPDLVGIPLVDPTPRRTVGLLFRHNAYRCAATRAFVAMTRAKLRVWASRQEIAHSPG
ncbi:MAG TPA: transcriptional regulator CynR [Chloroflexus aurantiacus]|jgi:LysR family cyn operon transcriptional activator|uniref:LysR substrate-binding n=1 Tax=Chloroflexus aurantiacus (strain ATCC 29366 / DSM 635 / J-10-fl) TaxID=324602 RepID=A9WGB3_CHLAA|nr:MULTISPECIES: transcriptional regulator CynR [Chloroflexus]ABY34034.1 LysR substrate-binding [Chloroflexus aurantiacus J-10-fl]RMG53534.1 MAG: transcriptional regulator CynR [Chloroflexota bacterium]GIV93724.1 MAG: LysR family transcriptional regulator [Chloroflexus sp.]HBW66068.1 transcriptional regulator CynR [Chloroflexus aurantiacus]